MPKTSRGGKAGATTATPQPVYTNPGTPITFTTRSTPLTAQQRRQVQANALNFQPATQKQAQQIHQAQAQQMQAATQHDINAKYAIAQYIRSDTQGNGKSRAQNLNQKLMIGAKLDPTERGMVRGLDKAMTPIGQDIKLYRADHAITPQGSGLMQRLGLPNYQNMSQAQLQKALIGRTFTEGKYLSTSEVKSASPFISGPQSGGRSLMWNINAPGTTKAIRGDTKQTEQILARGGNYRITGVRFTGLTAHPASGGSYKQIEIDVDII